MANTNIDNAKKISELATASKVASSDRLVVLYDTTGNTQVRTVTIDNFNISNNIPATSSSNGTPGNIRYSFSHIYICVANNTWKRCPIDTW